MEGRSGLSFARIALGASFLRDRMASMQKVRTLLKRMLLGPVNYPQTIRLGLYDPQAKVDVWLHGLDLPIEVTQRHMLASCAPLTICIGLQQEQSERAKSGRKLALRFHQHAAGQRFLGEIGLRFVSSFSVGTQHLCLFHVTHHRNRCLPLLHLWAHYLQYARTYEPERNFDVPITLREARAMIIYFLCPRPVVLVTVVDGQVGNMFPMNLMGPVGSGYFAFALNSHRSAAPLVHRAGRVVLSSVPLEQAAVVSKMGANHRKSSIEWNQLPFATITPDAINAPVPAFALTVREMQVIAECQLGSHTLFVAKTTAEQHFADSPQFFTAHGLYQAW